MADKRPVPPLEEFRKLPASQQEEVLRTIGEDALFDGSQFASYFQAYSQTGGSTPDKDFLTPLNKRKYEPTKEAQGQAAVQEAATQASTNQGRVSDANKDGKVDEKDQAAATEAETALGLPSGTLKVSALPAWVAAKVQPRGQTDLTRDQQNRLVEWWNMWNPANPVDSFEDVLPILEANPTLRNEKILDAALDDDEPILSYEMKVPGGGSVKLTDEQMTILSGSFGLDPRTATQVAKYAGVLDLKTSTGELAWQPLAALSKAADREGVFTGALAEDDRTAALEAKKERLRNLELGRKAKGSVSNRAEFQEIENLKLEIRKEEQALSRNKQRRKGADNSVLMLGKKYEEGLTLYGQDPELAYLHALDPALVKRVTSGWVTGNVSSEDFQKAGQLFLDGGFSPDDMAKLGFFTSGSSAGKLSGAGYLDYLDLRDAIAKAGGAGATKRTLDQDGVKQQVEEMWQAMFMEDAPDSVVQAFLSSANSALASAPDGQDFDLSNRLQSFLEKTGKFQELYGKADGLDWQSYQAQFGSASNSMLGAQIDKQAIQAGMKTGKLQTTVGQALGNNLGAADNSTLMGRLARAASVVNSQT
ncbi:MAG TPA: hypothetical protein VJQ57_09260 [Acidimicrobiia bacterium]|nr:hypothetical protein [Acidimicrobiia bacterium]